MGARIAVSWQWGCGMRCAEVESRTMIAVDLSGFLEECCCRWRGKSCLPHDEKLTLVRAASAEEASGQCEGEILAFSLRSILHMNTAEASGLAVTSS